MLEISKDELKFCEYFVSLEGEGYTIGESVLFMRLSGGCGKDGICSCKFCDTKYSWQVKPEHWSLDDSKFRKNIMKEIGGRGIRRVTLTGGEPLKYIDKFDYFVKNIKQLMPSLRYIGIESNGAMLSKESNTLELLKQFNSISRQGIMPALTMSPKIDYEASWSGHKTFTQEAVTELYFDVFKNVENIIAPYKVFYKFIYDYTNEIIPWDHTKQFVDKLLDIGVPRERIMLMALTPDDPEGKDKDFWDKSQHETARKALQEGVRYSPRLHVSLGLE